MADPQAAQKRSPSALSACRLTCGTPIFLYEKQGLDGN
jgi:hypothetical protein